jgi:hypothetical protein
LIRRPGYPPGRGTLLLAFLMQVGVHQGFGQAPARLPLPPDTAEGTRALTGLKAGGLAGGVLGGVVLGTLAAGLCDAADCSGSFPAGALLGGLVGGAYGGVVGLVVGSAIPASSGRGRPSPSRAWTLGGGVRWSDAREHRGTVVWSGVSTRRPTTSRVWFGLEVAYLGRGVDSSTIILPDRSRGELRLDERRKHSSWTGGVLAVRKLGEGPSPGPYVLASAGVYPLFETRTFERSGPGVDPGEPTSGRESSWTPYPGIGLGAGLAGARIGPVQFGGEVRLLLPLGGLTTTLSVGMQARLGGR